MIIQVTGLDDLDKELNSYAMRVYAMRVWELYSWHFQSLQKLYRIIIFKVCEAEG